MLIKKPRTLKEYLIPNINLEAIFRILKDEVDYRLDTDVFGWREWYTDAIKIIQTMDPISEIREDYIYAEDGEDIRPCSFLDMYDDPWKRNMSRCIVRAPGVNCSTLELIAYALWYITFFGFSPSQVRDNFRRRKEERSREYFEKHPKEYKIRNKLLAHKGRVRIHDRYL